MAVFKGITPEQIESLSSALHAGVDEVGRGPLVGNVVTAAVILDPNNPITGLNDSKKLTEKNVNCYLQKYMKKHFASMWVTLHLMR